MKNDLSPNGRLVRLMAGALVIQIGLFGADAKRVGAADLSTVSKGSVAPSALANVPAGYHIGAGDVLQIVVWKEAEASVPAAVVRADGKISMPLIKEVMVMGLTPSEAEKLMAEKLSPLIHDPDVTVVAKEIHSQRAYLLGAVRKEGPIVMQAAMTVLQAITEAGGLTDYAKPKSIYILRNENGKQVRMPFNYSAVIKGDRMEQNVILLPNDTIIVPH